MVVCLLLDLGLKAAFEFKGKVVLTVAFTYLPCFMHSSQSGCARRNSRLAFCHAAP